MVASRAARQRKRLPRGRYSAGMMTISTVNFSRIALAERADFFAWLREPTSDVVCLQGTNAERAERARTVAADAGWNVVFSAPGHGGHGVAILSRVDPENSRIGFDTGGFDDSGRYAEVDLQDVVVGSVHLPPGAVDAAATDEREDFLQAFTVYLGELRARAEAGSKEVLICGAGNLVDGADAEVTETVEHQRSRLARAFTEVGYLDVLGAVRMSANTAHASRFPNYQMATYGMAGRMVTARTETFARQADAWSEGAAVTVEYDL